MGTNSYEKLEFLGEAVLDYLVTCYIYTHTDSVPTLTRCWKTLLSI